MLTANIIKNMIGIMIILPENPEKDFLYIFDGFYKALLLFRW